MLRGFRGFQYHNKEALLFTIDPHYDTLSQIPLHILRGGAPTPGQTPWGAQHNFFGALRKHCVFLRYYFYS